MTRAFMNARITRAAIVAVNATLLVGCPSGSSLCKDQPCEPERWKVVRAIPSGVRVNNTLDYDFVQQDPFAEGVVSISVRSGGQLAALALRSGEMGIAPLGETEPDRFSLAGRAEGVAWSNGGAQLAVVVAGAAGRSLVLLNESLEVVDEFELPDLLPLDLGRNSRARYVVSWSADDRWVAITVDELRGASEPDGRIVRVADGLTHSFEALNAYFVNDDTLLGRSSTDAVSPGQPGTLKRFTVGESGVASSGKVDGPQYIMASDPVSGVFATVEQSAPVGYPQFPIGLRTLDAGPEIVFEGYNALVSISVALLPSE